MWSWYGFAKIKEYTQAKAPMAVRFRQTSVLQVSDEDGMEAWLSLRRLLVGNACSYLNVFTPHFASL